MQQPDHRASFGSATRSKQGFVLYVNNGLMHVGQEVLVSLFKSQHGKLALPLNTKITRFRVTINDLNPNKKFKKTY